jgi:hypothetical protein
MSCLSDRLADWSQGSITFCSLRQGKQSSANPTFTDKRLDDAVVASSEHSLDIKDSLNFVCYVTAVFGLLKMLGQKWTCEGHIAVPGTSATLRLQTVHTAAHCACALMMFVKAVLHDSSTRVYCVHYRLKMSRFCLRIPPNVVIQWLTPLLRIWEIPASNLGQKTAYPD